MKILETFIPGMITWDAAGSRHYSQIVSTHRYHMDSSAIRVFMVILAKPRFWGWGNGN